MKDLRKCFTPFYQAVPDFKPFLERRGMKGSELKLDFLKKLIHDLQKDIIAEGKHACSRKKRNVRNMSQRRGRL